LLLSEAKKHIDKEYTLTIKSFYAESLKARYPLDKDAQEEVTLDDFSQFFKPKGIEQRYFDQFIAAFVDVTHKPWRLKKAAGKRLPMSRRAIEQFERASEIRQVFFSDGDKPTVNFSLKAQSLDANVSRFDFDFLGERFSYRHGPAKKYQVEWPGDQEQTDIRFEFEDYYGLRTGDGAEGVWSLFRFVDDYPLKKSRYANKYQLVMEKEGKKAVFEVTVDKAINPFALDYLSDYQSLNHL